MFKSTTVAVEGSFRESCCDDAQEENHSCAAQDSGGPIHSSSCGLASNQSLWPYNGRAKKQTFRRKIAFSFSFRLNHPSFIQFLALISPKMDLFIQLQPNSGYSLAHHLLNEIATVCSN